VPNIAAFHPPIVHFVVALLFVGVAMRVVSLTGRLKFTGPAAATLILLGTVAAFAAVQSGTQAHGPVERIPGVRSAVVEHEEAAEWVRDLFLGVAVLEILGLGLVYQKNKWAKGAFVASALVGLVGLAALYRAADYGGQLVYSYAGGPGLRTGNPEDVGRLFVAGTYEQAMQDRQAGRRESAAGLFETLAARFPDDAELQLLAVDSLIQDRQDPQTALARLETLALPDRLQLRGAMLKVNAYVAAGDRDAARAELDALKAKYPDNRQVQRRIEQFEQR